MQNGPPDDRMCPGIGNGRPRYLHNNNISVQILTCMRRNKKYAFSSGFSTETGVVQQYTQIELFVWGSR